MKVFRKVTPGRNPDIEVHEALTQAGSEHVAALYGWLEATQEATGREHDDPVQLAMLQQFLRTASDGWDLALASVRDLFAEADLHADEVGGDFAAESHRLGVATAEVHETLSDQFPTETWDTEQVTALAAAMRDRLEAALTVVPELETHAGALREAFDAVAAITGPVVVQRVHGDLHLGQTLRTVRGWKIVDFEGEPAKPLQERIRPDSRWRDVAGMLRSLDYAAHAVEADVEEGAQIAYRALEWVVRNQSAFLEGYAEGRGVTDGLALSADEETLLSAYVLDKAIYETVYETRNRPDWLGIPMRAVQRLVGPQGSPETTEVFER
jgi:maltokinase